MGIVRNDLVPFLFLDAGRPWLAVALRAGDLHDLLSACQALH